MPGKLSRARSGGESGLKHASARLIEAVPQLAQAVGAGQAENPRLKMLAVVSPRRLPSISKVPTMAEGGVSGVDQTAWLCVFGPPGVPDGVRERIAREVVAIANDPAYQTKLRNTGFEPLGLDAQATARMYRDEVARWTAFIKERGLPEQAK